MAMDKRVFDGTHPDQVQSPPSRAFSIKATLAPSLPANEAAVSPAAPPPITTRSYSTARRSTELSWASAEPARNRSRHDNVSRLQQARSATPPAAAQTASRRVPTNKAKRQAKKRSAAGPWVRSLTWGQGAQAVKQVFVLEWVLVGHMVQKAGIDELLANLDGVVPA